MDGSSLAVPQMTPQIWHIAMPRRSRPQHQKHFEDGASEDGVRATFGTWFFF
jgi:hypothetical protein